MAVNVDVYVVSYLNALSALQSAQNQAMAMAQNAALDFGQRADVGALASDLEAQILLLTDAHNRFMTEFALANPPNQATVDLATAKANELAKLVADNILASANLEAVIGIVIALNELVAPPDGSSGANVAAAVAVPQHAVKVELAMASTTTRRLSQIRALK